MISKFFIDRPIFATVLSVVITLIRPDRSLVFADRPVSADHAALGLGFDRLPRSQRPSGRGHGGRAIEQQVTGVPGMLYMSSHMGNDGSYSLSVTFDVSVDLNTALVMVQNRVTLAMPLLPTPVQNQGITIRKRTPDILCMVNFFLAGRPLRRHLPEQFRPHQCQGRASARGGRIGHQHHGRARLQRPRLAGSAKIGFAQHDGHRCGQRDPQPEYRSGAWAARAAADELGAQAFQFPLDTLGRLHEPEQFENIIVKVGNGQPRTSSANRARMAPSPSSTTEFVHISTQPFATHWHAW